ncbi:MAG: hypothetical protein EBZ48_01275 [Proteobacteria bacterium]|nr:hypothetical protein [Pseudomonadota bacterium]
MAHDITAIVGPDAPLRVVRTAREEYFDPLLYYLNRSVELQSPERTELQCPGFTLARQSWFDALPEQVRLNGIEIALSTEEWLNRTVASSSAGNRLALLRCKGS